MAETGRDGYAGELKKTLKERFPDCMVIRNDPNSNFQGIPDFLVLNKDRWVALEVKADDKARHRPNQAYYIDKFNDMSYAAFIHPGNEEEILNEVQQALQPTRRPRLPKSQ